MTTYWHGNLGEFLADAIAQDAPEIEADVGLRGDGGPAADGGAHGHNSALATTTAAAADYDASGGSSGSASQAGVTLPPRGCIGKTLGEINEVMNLNE